MMNNAETRQSAIQHVRQRTCDGSCEKHVGEVKKVKVTDSGFNWGEFWYCEEAISEDIRRGLSIEYVA